MRPRLVLASLLAGLLVALLPAAASAAPRADSCRPYAKRPCLLPFPNDLLTVRDKRTPTGRRVHLPAAAMPVNATGRRMAARDYDRADGFSPGGAIVARVPGFDTPAAFRRTHMVSVADLSRAYARRQPLLLIDERTHRRQLVWGELDAHAPKPADVTLLIHPGRNLREGHRYVVALRYLKNAKGDRITAPHWFRELRDHAHGGPRTLRRDRARYRRIFRVLRCARVSRRGLVMAWDFTVASRRSLTARLLHIRNAAFRRLGDRRLADGKVHGRAPAFQVDTVEDFTPAQDPEIARRVTGTFQVPCYLNETGCPPGARFHYASHKADALPTRLPGNSISAPFICNIPRAALRHPGRPSLYGHGLLGTPGEVNAGNVKDMAAEHDMVFCATAWAGMSKEDFGNVAGALQDLSKFPTVVDRLQQGVLDFLYLGRLMVHPQGFVTNAAFRPRGTAVIDTRHLYYDGNSQGGIEGGITTSVAPDFTRAVLGVSGMDYGGLLLQRSKDWPTYEAILNGSYPDRSERTLLLALIQQLWDRGEPDGYANHMTTHPLPGTPRHKVLMQIAFGDFQVTDYAAETEARTIGARMDRPALDPGRWPGKRPGQYMRTIPHFPWRGSAFVYWDDGPGLVAPPPLANVPPTTGSDPHEHPRATKAARVQKSAFLHPNGRVVDVCGGKPCHTDVYTP